MDDRPGLFTPARVAGRFTLLALGMLSFTACGGSKAVPPLTITPTTATIDSGATESMRATGGHAPYRYAVVSGAGSIDATTGVYTAPQAATTALVSVTDNAGASAKATLTVNAPLATATLTLSVFPGSSQVIAVAGGEAPYVFSIVSGPGSIDAASGRYTASTGGSATINITDALGSSVEVTVTADRVYQQPTAVDDLVAFSAGSTVVVNVLANDLDPDGGPLTVSIVQAPTVGTATVQADGTVQLSLPAGFRGFTRFSYAIANGGGFTSMASAGVFVATAPLQLAWLGDDFTPGTQEIVVDSLLAPRRVNAPLTAGQSIGNAILRTDGTVPEAGYTVSTTASGVATTFAARLDGSTPPVVLPQATTVNALSGDGLWALVHRDPIRCNWQRPMGRRRFRSRPDRYAPGPLQVSQIISWSNVRKLRPPSLRPPTMRPRRARH